MVAERRRAKRHLEKYPSRENIEIYKKKTTHAKKICLENKRKSFHDYVETFMIHRQKLYGKRLNH